MKTIMLVDDSATVLLSISGILTKAGFKVVTANSAEDGQKKLAAGTKPDLLITDLNMPVMDGQQLIKYIRQDLGNSIIPILMVTSEDNETRLSNVHKAGVSGICDKPFDPQTVKEMLFRVLGDA